MNRCAIRVEGLGKRYRLGTGRNYNRFSEVLQSAVHYLATAPIAWLRGGESPHRPASSSDAEFWALKDITFDLQEGEVVGLIGRNGAGKSTLLKILSRITQPTEGRFGVRGRVGSLLEVGTGFHFELTGRENIFLNGAILGMRRQEVLSKFDEIVEFAGIETFLDTPVKRYSSGMAVRLGFAVAAHLDTEILIVDEVLAVGDTEFQKKCLGKMGEVASSGRTVLFVSHNMGTIRQLCTSCIVLSDGKSLGQFPPHLAIQRYLNDRTEATSAEADLQQSGFRNLRILGRDHEQRELYRTAEPILVSVDYHLHPVDGELYFTVLLEDPFGQIILLSDSRDRPDNRLENLPAGTYNLKVELPECLLAPGRYYVTVHSAVRVKAGPPVRVASLDRAATFSVIDPDTLRSEQRAGFFGTRLNWSAMKTN